MKFFKIFFLTLTLCLGVSSKSYADGVTKAQDAELKKYQCIGGFKIPWIWKEGDSRGTRATVRYTNKFMIGRVDTFRKYEHSASRAFSDIPHLQEKALKRLANLEELLLNLENKESEGETVVYRKILPAPISAIGGSRQHLERGCETENDIYIFVEDEYALGFQKASPVVVGDICSEIPFFRVFAAANLRKLNGARNLGAVTHAAKNPNKTYDLSAIGNDRPHTDHIGTLLADFASLIAAQCQQLPTYFDIEFIFGQEAHNVAQTPSFLLSRAKIFDQSAVLLFQDTRKAEGDVRFYRARERAESGSQNFNNLSEHTQMMLSPGGQLKLRMEILRGVAAMWENSICNQPITKGNKSAKYSAGCDDVNYR